MRILPILQFVSFLIPYAASLRIDNASRVPSTLLTSLRHTEPNHWIPKTFSRPTTRLSVQNTSVLTTALVDSLPQCNNVVTTALISGSLGLVSQLVLTAILRKSSNPSVKKDPSYTAHNIVALILMMYVSYIGVVGYYLSPLLSTAISTTTTRLLTHNPTSLHLASVILGIFIGWDIPTTLSIPKLRKWDVIIHHVCMAIVAYYGTITPMLYVLYYFGVVELSSIPLVIHDQLDHACTTSEKVSPRLEKWMNGMKIVAALSFTAVRAFHFTKVTLLNFLPDVRFALRNWSLDGGVSRLFLQGIGVASLGFTTLQLYWFSLIVRSVLGGEEEIKVVEDSA